MPDLNDQFNGAMFTIYRRAKAGAKYTPTVFLSMLNARGGVMPVTRYPSRYVAHE
jgi:hypothetical protein